MLTVKGILEVGDGGGEGEGVRRLSANGLGAFLFQLWQVLQTVAISPPQAQVGLLRA